MDDDLVRAEAIGLAHGRALGIGGRFVIGQRPVLTLTVDVPAAEAVWDDVKGRRGRHALNDRL